MSPRSASRALAPAAALAAVAALAGPAAGSSSEPPKTTAAVKSYVKITSDTTATVKARYRCTADSAEQVHLWVSVKQGPNGTAPAWLAEEGSGSSNAATVWLQSHAGVATCDGHKHSQRFVVDQQEQGYGKILEGRAYVQFCLFDATTGEQPVSSMVFKRVRD
jgi:hypothetical protein